MSWLRWLDEWKMAWICDWVCVSHRWMGLFFSFLCLFFLLSLVCSTSVLRLLFQRILFFFFSSQACSCLWLHYRVKMWQACLDQSLWKVTISMRIWQIWGNELDENKEELQEKCFSFWRRFNNLYVAWTCMEYLLCFFYVTCWWRAILLLTNFICAYRM